MYVKQAKRSCWLFPCFFCTVLWFSFVFFRSCFGLFWLEVCVVVVMRDVGIQVDERVKDCYRKCFQVGSYPVRPLLCCASHTRTMGRRPFTACSRSVASYCSAA